MLKTTNAEFSFIKIWFTVSKLIVFLKNNVKIKRIMSKLIVF